MSERQTVQQAFDDLLETGLRLFESMEIMKAPFHYLPDEIPQLENVMVDMFPNEIKHDSPGAIPFGLYFAKILLNAFPGSTLIYRLDTEKHLKADELLPENERYITEFGVSIPYQGNNESNNATLFPVLRAMKFLKDRTDGLQVMFDLIRLQVLNLMNMEELLKNHEPGEWVDVPGVGTIRYTNPDDLPK